MLVGGSDLPETRLASCTFEHWTQPLTSKLAAPQDPLPCSERCCSTLTYCRDLERGLFWLQIRLATTWLHSILTSLTIPTYYSLYYYRTKHSATTIMSAIDTEQPDLKVDETPISPIDRRNSLEKHLQHRPDAQDLKNRHILLDTNASP